MIVCKACFRECSSMTVDYGIGHYEFGSISAVDKRLAEVSNCCEEDVVDLDEDGSLIDEMFDDMTEIGFSDKDFQQMADIFHRMYDRKLKEEK